MDDAPAKVDELLSGYLDGELTQRDRRLVDRRLERCARYRARLEELAKLRTSVGRLRDDMDPEDRERWREIMDNAFDRTLRGIGWLLVVGAVLLLVGYGGYEFILSDVEPPFVKWAVAAVYVGLAVLLLTVLRQRLRDRKTDRYKDVEI